MDGAGKVQILDGKRLFGASFPSPVSRATRQFRSISCGIVTFVHYYLIQFLPITNEGT